MKLILSFFLLLPLLAFGQKVGSNLYPLDIPEFQFESGEIIYQQIFKVKANQNTLRSLGLEAISEMYRSSDAVIDLDDLDNGIIVAKGNIHFFMNGYYAVFGSYVQNKTVYTVSHSLKIEFKEEKVRLTFSKFRFLKAELNDGTKLNFEYSNELDEEYVNFYKTTLKDPKQSKTVKANIYNKGLILNELDRISKSFLEKFQESYLKNLKDDW